MIAVFFFFQAEDGIRDLVRSRGLGDVYKRQIFPRGRGFTDGMRRAKQRGHERDSIHLRLLRLRLLSLIHI